MTAVRQGWDYSPALTPLPRVLAPALQVPMWVPCHIRSDEHRYHTARFLERSQRKRQVKRHRDLPGRKGKHVIARTVMRRKKPRGICPA